MAAELRAVGVDFSFAPCVDLDYGVSEIIGDRAFHAQADEVAALAVAYMAGMREAGMEATAKHFPGHGAVVADSHLELPVDRRGFADLEADMRPYRVLIDNHLSAVMAAHIVYPRVDSHPASLSHRWITDILRGEFGFHGCVFADDLSMAGAAAFGDVLSRARLGMAAGCDVLPICNDRKAVAEVLDHFKPAATNPASQARIMRMRARGDAPADPRRQPALDRCGRVDQESVGRARAGADRGRLMSDLDADLYRRLLLSAPVGVALVDAADPEHRVVYVNRAFESLTGFDAAELIGNNLRMLQAGDREQDGRQRLREALTRQEPCHVLMRNYRKDGTLFWNEMTVLPVHDANGRLTHFAGYHRDASERLRVQNHGAREVQGVPGPPPITVALREDRLTGVFTLPYFEELLKRDWAAARRDRRSIAAFCIDIDALDLYNATFGRAAGDSTIRRVAHCICGCLRRASDVVARVEGGNLIAFAPGVANEQALRIGQTMTERIRDLRIHHPRSSVLRYVSVSVGVAAATPDDDDSSGLLQRARRQLGAAKQTGRNRAS